MTSYEEVSDSYKDRKLTFFEKLKDIFTFERVTRVNVVICTVITVALLGGLIYIYLYVI
jgi:hypothetical protein